MPNFDIENTHNCIVAGVDEAGRGPWAGPVVAAAVIIHDRNLEQELLSAIDDSKKLTAIKREKLFIKIFEEEKEGKLAVGIGESSVAEIDELNILQATFLAMNRAVLSLKIKPEIAIIDGNQKPKNFCCNTQTVIGGDAKSISIAAASIIAKVHRDKIMKDLSLKYPHYSFEKNAGYGTQAHIEGLKAHGICSEHRKTYKPIKEFVSLC